TLLSTAAVLASVVAGGWWAQHDAGRASRADSADRRDQAVRPLAQTSVGAAPIPAPTVQPATAQPATVQPVTAQPATAQPATAQPTAAGQPVNWLAELARADAVREHAYATGDPALLAQVYPPGGLLDRDRAQLAGQVPAGCSLVGAVTQYSALDVQTAGPQSAKVIVTAVLAPARLTCAGAQKATTPPVGPVRLAVSLSRGPDAVWRIEDQRLAS
ncbi:MAG: serine/threonine protein kinase, partial [Jatrophihabitantaceae bacterium]|nr:serine/threonine protein kinase [Jatrophihabitantaceae bacterium]